MIFSPAAKELEIVVSTFEREASNGSADIAAFLPPADSRLFLPTLRELVRVDMELAFSKGKPRKVDDYLTRFPQLRSDATGLGEICFEEFRLRQIAGEHPDASVYGQRFQVDTSHWPVDNATERELATQASCYLERSTNGTAPSTAERAHDASTRLFCELHKASPEAARNLAEALTNFPEVGQSIAGYDLLDDLGHGAFSRVFLARERAVDGRRVALKVTGDMRSEVRALARLRHTNIVPVYSVKESGPFHAICMPFCGSLTLADVVRNLTREKTPPPRGEWIVRQIHREPGPTAAPLLLRLSQLSFVDAVLEIAIRIARGLAHAHERGICHRDLKPANVLLADDGEPLLLDFNLAAEMHPGGLVVAALIGGTLPYMAPEQLRSFSVSGQNAAFTADVYSLGLVLYEVLAGKLPSDIPHGTIDDIVNQLIKDRSVQPPNLHNVNSCVSPAFAAIIAKCLHPDPARRYPTATELVDDLTRQRDHQSLRFAAEPSWRESVSKWAKRHPRLSSGSVIATFAAMVLFGLGFAAWSIHRDRAGIAERENLRLFQDEFSEARLALSHPAPDSEMLRRGMEKAQKAWNRVSDSNAELIKQRGMLAILQAHGASRQAEYYPDRRSMFLQNAVNWNQQAKALMPSGNKLAIGQAEWLAQLQDKNVPAVVEPDLASTANFELGWWYLQRNRGRAALKQLVDATRADPDSVNAWFLRGMAEFRLGRFSEAESALSTCIALNPKLPDGYHSRAIVQIARGRDRDAIVDLNRALELQPDSLSILVNRGIAKFHLHDLPGADKDLTAAIDGGYPETRLYFLRARVRDKSGDRSGAAADRTLGFEIDPVSEDDWLARMVARLPSQPQAALEDLEGCLKQYARSSRAWENKAHVYDAYLHKPDEAIRSLDEAIRIDPESPLAFAARGVLKARRGDFTDARSDAAKALDAASVCDDGKGISADGRPDVYYQVAGIYALTSKERPAELDRCVFLLSRALQYNYGLELIETDPELVSIRGLPEVKRLMAEAKKWKNLTKIGGSGD